MRPLHAQDSAIAAASAGDLPPTDSRTETGEQVPPTKFACGRKGSIPPAARALRRRVAHFLKHLAEHVVKGGYAGIARAWNVDESDVRARANPDHEKGGRVDTACWFILPKTSQAAYLAFAEDVVEHGALPHLTAEEHALRLTEIVGRVASDARHEDHEELAHELPALATEAAAATVDNLVDLDRRRP